MSKTPWIVVDAKKQEMRCNSCGDTHPLSSINGARLDVAVEFLKAFENVHKKCKPVVDKPEAIKLL